VQSAGTFASIKAEGTGIFGSVANRFLPGWGFKPFTPEKIQAVYIPSWFVDADISINSVVGLNSEDNPIVHTHIQSVNS
jgi:hypothetical protein